MPVDPLLPGVLTAGLGINSNIAKDSPEKIRDAASQFEALLISQVLKASHEGEDQGWLGTGEDQTAGAMMSLAEDFFARAMAARGGFGLARMVASGLVASGLGTGASPGSVNNSSPEPLPEPAEAPHTRD